MDFPFHSISFPSEALVCKVGATANFFDIFIYVVMNVSGTFSRAVIKYPDRSQLKGERLYLLLEGTIHCGGRVVGTGT